MGSNAERQRQTILIVDDDVRVLSVLADLLERAEFEVLTATSAAEATQILAVREPGVALIDILMPGINGLDLCRRLKADPKTAEIRVILLSAMSDSRDVEAGIEAGGGGLHQEAV